MSNIVWIVDTSVLCNIMSIPNMDQDKKNVLQSFEKKIKNNDSFLLPYTVIVEIGNHIGQVSSEHHRRELANKLIEIVNQSIDGDAPWKIMKIPSVETLRDWLADFPDSASKTKGYGDHSLIKEWEEYGSNHQGLIVHIWSLDNDLQGY